MPRTYADISHFRAPFKNWPYLGMGPGAGGGMGADVAAGPASAFDPASVIDTVNGVRVFKPVVADQIMKQLSTMSVVFLDNDNVKLDAKTTGDIRESADAWVKRKLSEGKTVVAGTVGGAHLFGLPIVVDRFLTAVKGKDAEIAATAGAAPLGAVLARPGMFAGLFSGLGPVGIAAVSLLAVGGIVMLVKKHKRGRHSYAANRSKRRRFRANKTQGWLVVYLDPFGTGKYPYITVKPIQMSEMEKVRQRYIKMYGPRAVHTGVGHIPGEEEMRELGW